MIAPSTLPTTPSRVLFGERRRCERRPSEPPPDHERTDVGARTRNGEGREQRDAERAQLDREQDAMDEQDRDDDAAHRGKAKVPQRPSRIRPHDGPGETDEDEPADQPFRGGRPEDGDRGDDRQVGALQRNPVVDGQVHQLRPLDQRDRTERGDEDRDPDRPDLRRDGEDEREYRHNSRRVAAPYDRSSPAVAERGGTGPTRGSQDPCHRSDHQDGRRALDRHSSRRMATKTRSMAVSTVPRSNNGPNATHASGPTSTTAIEFTPSSAIRPGLDRMPR